MSMETALVALLKSKCPLAYPDVAPEGVAAPYVVWQGLGGASLAFLDNTAADKRQTLMQIAAWSPSRQQATTLIRDIEDAMRAATAFTAKPQGEPLSTHEPDTKLYGSIQRFLIWSAR